MNPEIDVKELKARLQNEPDFLFLDVREEWEYEELNIGARLMPLMSIPHRLGELQPYKDQEIVVHCKSGNRSRQARIFLESQGFTEVRSLTGGLEAFLA